MSKKLLVVVAAVVVVMMMTNPGALADTVQVIGDALMQLLRGLLSFFNSF